MFQSFCSSHSGFGKSRAGGNNAGPSSWIDSYPLGKSRAEESHNHQLHWGGGEDTQEGVPPHFTGA